MKKFYIAGDLEVQALREYMDKIAAEVEKLGMRTFVPHRDVPIPEQVGDEKGLLNEDDFDRLGEFVFTEDLKAIQDCDGAIFLLDGLCWGTTFEMGYAYAYREFVKQDFILVGVYTKSAKLDLMRRFACDYKVQTLEDLTTLLLDIRNNSHDN